MLEIPLYYMLFRKNGGWLTVFENQEEWECVEHYVSQAYDPYHQKYAISLRSDFGGDGIYKWQHEDGTESFPDFYFWAPGHPNDGPCVSMQVDGGFWYDGDCYQNEDIFAICEKDLSIAPTPTHYPTTTTHEETSDWIDICHYQDHYGSTCCPPGMEQSEYYVVPFEQPWENQETICQYVGN